MLETRPSGCAHLGEHKSDYDFEYIFHLIRNPLTCISSMLNFFHEADYVFHNAMPNLQGVVRGDLYSVMRMYYEVNKQCDSHNAVRVKLENIDYVAKDIARQVFGVELKVPKIEKVNVSSKPPKPLTWKKLYGVNQNLAAQIYEMAFGYGYVHAFDIEHEIQKEL